MRRHDEAASEHLPDRAPAGDGARGRVAVSLAAAFAVAAALVVFASGPSVDGEASLGEGEGLAGGVAAVAPSPQAAGPGRSEAALRDEGLAGAEVALTLPGGSRDLARPSAGGRVEADARAVCIGVLATGSLCLDPGARVEAVPGRAEAYELVRGRLRVALEKPAATSLIVQVAGTRIETSRGTFTVALVSEETFVIDVESGEVRVGDDGWLRAGDRLSRSREANAAKATSRGIPRTAARANLLEEARAARAAGRLKRAAAIYEQIIARAASPEADGDREAARMASVAVGQLYLGSLGRPARALEAFERYLRGGEGALREEAEHGRIVALHRLGRAAEAERLTQAFRASHPHSRYVAQLPASGEGSD